MDHFIQFNMWTGRLEIRKWKIGTKKSDHKEPLGEKQKKMSEKAKEILVYEKCEKKKKKKNGA